MPKENTHLNFASDLAENNFSGEINKILKKYKKEFLLGSVFPDIFFYASNLKIQAKADLIHGKDGNETNQWIFFLLDLAKKNSDKKILAFTFGALTHFSLDINFHPIIYYLAGNYYDKNKKKKEQAIYRHVQLETFLDAKTNQFFLAKKNLMSQSFLREEKDFLAQLGISYFQLKVIYSKMLWLNRILFKSNFFYQLFYFLEKMGLVKKRNIGLFYKNLKRDKTIIPQIVKYKDLISGEDRVTKLTEIFTQAQIEAQEKIKVAQQYFLNNLSKREAKEIIIGQSLDTGKLGKSVQEIRFIKEG